MIFTLVSSLHQIFQDNEGKTPLHWSCCQGQIEATKLLLDQGAFPNHLDFSEERFSPLDGALIGGHNEVAQLLIEHGGLSINRIQVSDYRRT